MNLTTTEILTHIQQAKRLVFLTGAGASVPSGIPDYRSVTGLYTQSGVKEPEYLLSRRCLLGDTDDFHRFIKQLFHPDAQPNAIHLGMAALERDKQTTVITQNIDGLHGKAGSQNVVEFHGTLAACHCETCKRAVPVADFLQSYTHADCGGLVRPNVVLYDEGIDSNNIRNALDAIEAADTIVIVGTSFQVHPFASLIRYARPSANIYGINKEPIYAPRLDGMYLGDAVDVFQALV